MAYTACPAPASRESHQNAQNTLSIVATMLRPSRLTAALNSLSDRYSRFVEIRRQRRTLMSLSDAQLLDIGLTRADAEEEYRQSFRLL